MQALPFALFLVMLELAAGSFISLYVLDLRGDSSRNFLIFQGVLYVLFAGLTVLAMNAFASPANARGLGLDDAWLNAQGPLTLAFSALTIPWNLLLWLDRSPRNAIDAKTMKAKAAKAAEDGEKPRAVELIPTTRTVRLRQARFILGGATVALGLVTLIVVGMAYRTLASSRLDGFFVVASFVVGALALGGVMTAMLLGHWYLNTPTASGKPLEFVTILMLVTLALELFFSLLIGPSTAHPTLQATSVQPGTTIQTGNGNVKVSTPTAVPTRTVSGPVPQGEQQTIQRQAPLTTGAMVWLQIILGFISPLILGAVALYLTRGRSFQSATGMLYLCVSFVFIGEILAR
ncbi:MAG: hypothetical protein ABI068_02845, partial [Ktedonobacterales bacterium]